MRHRLTTETLEATLGACDYLLLDDIAVDQIIAQLAAKTGGH